MTPLPGLTSDFCIRRWTFASTPTFSAKPVDIIYSTNSPMSTIFGLD